MMKNIKKEITTSVSSKAFAGIKRNITNTIWYHVHLDIRTRSMQTFRSQTKNSTIEYIKEEVDLG